MKKEIIEKHECCPNKDRVCKLTTAGNIMEIMEMSSVNLKQTVQRLDKDTAVVLSTGEVIQLKHTENRAENSKGIYKTMKVLRDLINANVTVPDNCRWITLTYAENMTDVKRLYKDMDKFHKRFRYYCEQKGYPRPEYISVAEPQARGAWHIHEIPIFPDKAPFIPNSELAEIWGHGFVTIKKLDDVDNVGAYLTAYLCDLPVEDAALTGRDFHKFTIKECEYTDEGGEKQTKKFIKGARVYMYPTGMNFYRCSRGVKRPEVEWTTVDRANKKASVGTLTYEKYIRLSEDEFSSDISYRYFNSAKKECQQEIVCTNDNTVYTDVGTIVCTIG